MISHELDPDFERNPQEHPMTTHAQPKGKFGPVSKTATAYGGLTWALATIITYIVTQFGFDMPEAVAVAIAGLVSTIVTAIGGKIVDPNKTIEFQEAQGNLDTVEETTIEIDDDSEDWVEDDAGWETR